MSDSGGLPELTRDDEPADWAIKLRLALFETQRAAARHYHMLSGTISRYENGVITPPLPYLASLSRLLLDWPDPLVSSPADRAVRQEHLLTQIRNLVRWHPEQYERQFPFRDWAQLCHAADRYEGQHPAKVAAPEGSPPPEPPIGASLDPNAPVSGRDYNRSNHPDFDRLSAAEQAIWRQRAAQVASGAREAAAGDRMHPPLLPRLIAPLRRVFPPADRTLFPTQVQEALLAAFPTYAALSDMVASQLQEDLGRIAGAGAPRDTSVHLVQWALVHRRLPDLVAAAVAAKPTDRHLQRLNERQREGRPAVLSKPTLARIGFALVSATLLFVVFAIAELTHNSQLQADQATATAVAQTTQIAAAGATAAAAVQTTGTAIARATTLATAQATDTAIALASMGPTPLVRVTRMEFNPASPSDQENIVCYICTEGCAGVGVSIKVEINTAPDGSPNGEWVFLKEMGTPCYTEDNAPHWPTLDLPDGPHLVQATIKDCQGRTQTVTATYTLLPRPPEHPYLVSPAPDAVSPVRTVTFQWRGASRATSYTIWVGIKPNPEEAPIMHEIVTSTIFTATFPSDYAQLYWRVDAQNDKGRTQVGSQRFSIVSSGGPPVPTPTLAAAP